jgi:protoheme IX farnesyltransferase
MSTDGHEMVVPLITDPSATTKTRQSTIAAYFALTKPRIIELLLITTVPSMILAAGAWPGTWPVLATLIGGSLSAGGANALNNYVDRDIDQVMRRTRSRPLARQVVPPGNALVFGIALGIAGFAWLWATTNLLAAGISTAALLFYVFVYTLRLKRTSAQNIVIGGAAGAAPALVGWAAVTGTWICRRGSCS